MEIKNTQQEVLLVTATGFTSRAYCENNNESSKNLSEQEKLQDACWNGLVQDKLPEVFDPSFQPAQMYLWQLKEANHFLALEMGKYPKDIEAFYSIDPYAFLPEQHEN